MSDYEGIINQRNLIRNQLSSIDIAIQEQIDEINIRVFETGTQKWTPKTGQWLKWTPCGILTV